jgi:cell division protein FtsW
MIGVSFVKTDVFRDMTGFVTVISLLLLVYVLINPYEVPGKEQFKRWVEFPLIGSFQPSEIAKLALIMFLSFSMERHHKLIEKHWWMILPYIAVVGFICFSH